MRWPAKVGLAVASVLVAHGAAWFGGSTLVGQRLDRAKLEAAAQSIDVRTGAVERAGYPWAAGVVWHDVEFGPRGLPLGARVSTRRLVLTVVPSLLRAPTYRAEWPDPLRVTLPNGATVVLAAAAARVEAPWRDPATATLSAVQVDVQAPAEVARVARLQGTLRWQERTLAVRAEGVELPAAGLTVGPRPTTAAIDAALLGPPLSALGEGGANALAGWRDAGGAVRVSEAAIAWGAVDAEAEGRVTLDASLRPAGTGELRLAGAAEGLDAMAAAGVLAVPVARAVRALLGLLPATAEVAGRHAVRLPLVAGSGRLSVAGYPVLKLDPLNLP